MDIRYSVNQRDVKRYTTQELRNEFLIEKVFIEDDVTAVYSHVDRVVTLGALPKTKKINIEKISTVGKISACILFWNAANWALSISAEKEPCM